MIIFVRHGQAAASWGDHPDPGLSEDGARQAEAAAIKLDAFDIQRVYSSPMQRCQETARAFATHSGLPISIEKDVSEIPTPPGTDDRVTWLRALMSGNWSETEPLIKNWRQSLIDCVEALPDQTVVFSHFVAINALVGFLEATDTVTLFRPDYCSLTQIERTAEGLRLVQRGGEAGTQIL